MLARVLSAVVALAAVLAIGAILAKEGLVGLCCLVAAYTVYEYSFMVEKNRRHQLVFIVLAYLFFISFVFVSQSFLAFLLCFIALSAIFLLTMDQPIEVRMGKLSQWLMGIIYSAGLTGLVTHGTHKFGIMYFATLLAVSFGTDTFAYLIGRPFGKTKLLPAISPNKSLEGSLAGLVGGTVLGTYCFSVLSPQADWLILIFCCLTASAFSQIGDLFESFVKRHSGIKDSGAIMPGHGGILDRIDGLLFAGPFIFVGMLYLSHQAAA